MSPADGRWRHHIAFLFLFYEFFGVVTQPAGGWIASRSGLKTTLYGGLALQIFALAMSAVATLLVRTESVSHMLWRPRRSPVLQRT